MANKTYTIESIKEAVQLFIKTNGREPHYKDFTTQNNLPSIRQIQRRFGGLPELRKDLGLTILDHTKGTIRSQMAKKIQENCSKYEAELINKLFKKHHDPIDFNKTVTRHYAYQQYLPDKGHYVNIASDVGLTDRVAKHVILIDFFFPTDMHSFGGCVRSKRKKLRDHPVSLFNCTHEVLFVCVNPDISQDTIDTTGINTDGITVLSLDTFKQRFL
jgi:hypothetical protein